MLSCETWQEILPTTEYSEVHHKTYEGALRPKMAAALLLVLFGKNMEVGSQSQTTVSLAGRIAPDDEHSGCYHRPRHLQSRSVQTRPQCRFPGVSDRQTNCRFAREIPRLAGSAGRGTKMRLMENRTCYSAVLVVIVCANQKRRR